jgi:hypothetical protein
MLESSPHLLIPAVTKQTFSHDDNTSIQNHNSSHRLTESSNLRRKTTWLAEANR